MFPWLRQQLGIPDKFDVHLTVPPLEAEQTTPAQVFHDSAARFLDLQVAVNHALDTRNASVLAVSSTVLPLAFGLLSLTSRKTPSHASQALVASLVFYFLVLLCCWRASAIRGLEYRPHLPTLAQNSQTTNGEVLLEWVAREYMASTQANGISLERKARWVGAANTLLYAEALLLSLAALITLL